MKKDTKVDSFCSFFDLRLATSDHTLVILLPRAFAQSYFVTSLLRMHLQRCLLQDMHQNPDMIRLAGGKGREASQGTISF